MNSICSLSGSFYISAFKRKQQKFLFHNFEVLESFAKLFTQQKNGLGIFMNTLRINNVKSFQVWKVNNVMQSELHFTGLHIVLQLGNELIFTFNSLFRSFKEQSHPQGMLGKLSTLFHSIRQCFCPSFP